MNTPTEKYRLDGDVLKTTIWITVIRGFQLFISLVVAGLAARLMHDAYLDEEGLALAIVSFSLLPLGGWVLTLARP